MENFIGRNAFAVMAGLSLETIKKYRQENILPPPDAVVDNKPLWRTDTAQAWIAQRSA